MELVAALAAAVRMHLPAALARPAQTDRSRCSASAPACCPCSTCSGRPGSTCSDRPQPPPQCACSDRPSLRNQGSHRSANGAPQCECTCPLPLLDLLRQTVAPQPGQPPQCEVRSRRSAAPFALRQPPAMAVAVARCGRIDRRMAALVSERAAVRTRPHLSQQAFRRHEQHEHEPPTIAGAVVGACTHGYTGSCSCVSRTSVARAASARTASCCCMSSTSLARGHIPRRSLKGTQSLGAAGAGCGWHHRRAGARVWLRPAVARVRACMQKKAGETKKWLQRPGIEPGLVLCPARIHTLAALRPSRYLCQTRADSLRILYIYMAEHAKPRSRRWHRSRQTNGVARAARGYRGAYPTR